MQTLEYKIEINSPKQRVWDVLWGENTYPQWTRAFCPGSYAKTDWKEGSSVHFLTPDGSGMYSKVEKNIPSEVMKFKHLGILKDGKEMSPDEESKKWAGAMESYYLKEENGRTILECEVDIEDKHVEMFNRAFPEAFRYVKELSEQQ